MMLTQEKIELINTEQPVSIYFESKKTAIWASTLYLEDSLGSQILSHTQSQD